MQTIIFCREGEPVPDHEIGNKVDFILFTNRPTYKTSTLLIIEEVRARICEGQIAKEDIKILIEDNQGELHEKRIDDNGLSDDHWDSEFIFGKILARLFGF